MPFGSDIAAGVLAGKPNIPQWNTVSLTDAQIHANTANGLTTVGLFMVTGVLLCGVATAQQDQGRRRDEP